MADRNFDDLVERFEKRIYGGLKGDIRSAVIWRDLISHHPAINSGTPLHILDIGGGLGQFSIKLAALGHDVTCNDLSANMLEKAQQLAETLGAKSRIRWSCMPYQEFAKTSQQTFDVVLCHALLEWLEQPDALIPTLRALIKPKGVLSLCFYNPVGLVYRNLICGNFRYLDKLGIHQADEGSLTPKNPCAIEQVEKWLKEQGFLIASQSGIRVFSDYVLAKRGGNLSPEDVLKTELNYSTKEPYKRLGRYFHIVAINTNEN